MSLDEVKRKIMATAEEKAGGIKQAALRTAKGIAGDNESNIRKMLDSGRQRYAQEAKLQRERMVGVARVDARNRRLNAKQRLISEIIDEAAERLLALPDKEYLGLMERLFAAAELPECRCEVHISPGDEGRITPGFIEGVERRLSGGGRKVTLALSDIRREDIKGGFVVSAGQVEIDCSLDTLVRTKRDELEREAARILFGGEHA